MKNKKENKQPSAKSGLPVSDSGSWKYNIALLVILLVSFITYKPVLQNGLLEWDDSHYIHNNPLIYSFDFKAIFSQPVMGNYHPITILVLAIEYHLFGLSSTGYHAVNLILHLLNIILVYKILFRLSKKANVALVAALLFGVHPLHVESVAWAAELKDLLYTFFFLVSYLCYLRYLAAAQKKFYVFSLLLFALSLLSKAMAASLPVVLLLTDYFKERKLNVKVILEKVPFFLLALALGIIAVAAQMSADVTANIESFSLLQRMVFACYGFMTYLFLLIFPFNLSAVYPYPVVKGVADIPVWYYACVLLLTGLIVFVFYFTRFSKKIFFGIGFFAITVFLVLQLLPVSGAIMADRYSYVPSIGIFYLAGEGFHWLWSRKKKLISVAALSAFTIFFSVKTNAQCKVWKNDMTLWNDVIRQYQDIPFAYYNRGLAYVTEEDYDMALADFNKTIEMSDKYISAYLNRAKILYGKRKLDDALKDYNKVIELRPNAAEAYFNRGNLLMDSKRSEEGIKSFTKAIELDPDFLQVYLNRGHAFYRTKQYETAIADFSKAIALKADCAEAYFMKGRTEYELNRVEAGCADLQRSLDIGYQPAASAMAQLCR